MKKMSKGFTLIEIMIVVAIIAILAAIAIPNFISYRQQSQKRACESNKKTIQSACEAWAVRESSSGEPTMANLTEGTAAKPALIKTAPVCPGGGTYSIKKNATTGEYEVTCTGASPAHE